MIKVPDQVISVTTGLKGKVKLNSATSDSPDHTHQYLSHKVTHRFNGCLMNDDIKDIYLTVNGNGDYTIQLLGMLWLRFKMLFHRDSTFTIQQKFVPVVNSKAMILAMNLVLESILRSL